MTSGNQQVGVSASENRSASVEIEGLLYAVANVVSRWRRIAVIGSAATIVGLILGVNLPAEYRVRAAFIPHSTSASVPRLAGLAAQFGFSLPVGGGEAGSDFYADYLLSEAVLRRVVDLPVEVAMRSGSDSPSVALRDLLSDEDDSVARREDAIENLRDMLHVEVGRKSLIVRVDVNSSDSSVALFVARALLEEARTYSVDARQSIASAERQFVESRLATARGELESVESDLQEFLRANRSFAASPELMFQHDRLQRRVSLAQGVYEALAQSFEQSRIEEVRNTPVISVLEAPDVPVDQSMSPVVLGLLLGMMFTSAASAWYAISAPELRRDGLASSPAVQSLKRAVSRTRP